MVYVYNSLITLNKVAQNILHKPFKDASCRSAPWYTYNQLIYLQYVQYTTWIDTGKGIAKYRDTKYVSDKESKTQQ